jgi:hypothetical protein
MCPEAANGEVGALAKRGLAVELVEIDHQCYVLHRGLAASMPPWDRENYDILVAIPAAYDACSLDAFYLGLPYKFNGGEHPRVNGATINWNDRQWRLVSWHYRDGKPWTRGLDDLASHLTHCKGFFLNRGAVNDFR